MEIALIIISWLAWLFPVVYGDVSLPHPGSAPAPQFHRSLDSCAWAQSHGRQEAESDREQPDEEEDSDGAEFIIKTSHLPGDSTRPHLCPPRPRQRGGHQPEGSSASLRC
jgi:hypothetical protein